MDSRRYTVLGSLVQGLNKLAAVHNMAVLVTSGCATRIRNESGLGAILVSGVAGKEWDEGVASKLVLFRDFVTVPPGSQAQQEDQEKWNMCRYVGVQKAAGTTFAEAGEVGKVVAFVIEEDGLHSFAFPTARADQPILLPSTSSPARTRKRNFEEIADSDGEELGSDAEYGWIDADTVAAEGLIDEAALAEDASDT
ncbi:hypothetical protein LTR28_009844 [Elasticomyces elasticus]|nr:hypothetical protein LTR28_009844 [Elasticomyces elasticus]